jgi:hypothetical protein
MYIYIYTYIYVLVGATVGCIPPRIPSHLYHHYKIVMVVLYNIRSWLSKKKQIEQHYIEYTRFDSHDGVDQNIFHPSKIYIYIYI